VGKNSFLRGGTLSMQKKITEYQTIGAPIANTEG